MAEENKSKKPRNFIDKRYFGQIPDDSFLDFSPKNGYVMYKRAPKKTSFWYQIWKSGTQELNSMLSSAKVSPQDYSSVGDQLISLANAELNKEVSVIQKALKIDLDIKRILEDDAQFKEFIALINQLIMGKKQFEAAVKRVKNAIKRAGESWAPAPNISSLFLRQFIDDICRTFADIIISNAKGHEEEFYTGNFTSIESLLKDAYRKQFSETFKNIINQSSNFGKDSFFGKQEDYEEFLQYLEDLQERREEMDEVFDRLYKRIPFDQIFNVLKNSSDKIAKNLKSGNKNASSLGLTTPMKEASFAKSSTTGGTAAEIIVNILSNINISKDILTGKSSSYGFNPDSEIMKIDQGIIVSFSVDNIEKELKGSFEELNKKTFKDLNDAAEKISNFTEDVLSKIDDGFIIYSNQKMYSLADAIKGDKDAKIKGRRGFTGFSGGSSRKISSLREISDKVGNGDQIEKLITLAKSAMSGAYLFGSQPQITEAISLQLANFFAYLFFDDWVSFAHENSIGNVVHVFNLEGINLPLSYLLRELGEALQAAGHNTSSILKATVSYGQGVLFDKGVQFEGYHPTEEVLIATWNRQRDVADAETTFKIHFMGGFKELFSSWV